MAVPSAEKQPQIPAYRRLPRQKRHHGGSVSTASKSITFDAAYGTLPTPTKTGYDFAGWFTAASGGTQVTAATVHTTDGNVTIYAHWTAKTYTLTFNAYGGTVTPESKTVTYDSTYGTLPTPTRNGWTFKGWWTETGGGREFKSGDKVDITADRTLYAHWDKITYTITNSSSGASLGSYQINEEGDQEKALTPATKNGFTFAKWNFQTNSTPASSFDSGNVNLLKIPAGAYGNISVSPSWNGIEYTISFDEDGGDPVSDRTYISSLTQRVVDNLPKPTRTGYTFTGWTVDTQPTGGTATVSSDNKKLTIPAEAYGNIMLKAQWSINQYTITFKDGDSTISTIKQNYGTDVTAPADPTKMGYDFTGWDKEVPATMPAEDVTIKATWKIKTYTISIENNGNGSKGSCVVHWKSPNGAEESYMMILRTTSHIRSIAISPQNT